MVKIKKFKKKIGTRAEVMNNTAKMTSGGLMKKNLKYNKQGKIVSKKASKTAKKLSKERYKTKNIKFNSVGGSLIESMKNIHTSKKLNMKNIYNKIYNDIQKCESEYIGFEIVDNQLQYHCVDINNITGMVDVTLEENKLKYIDRTNQVKYQICISNNGNNKFKLLLLLLKEKISNSIIPEIKNILVNILRDPHEYVLKYMEKLSSNNNSSSKVKKELERMQGWWCFGNTRLTLQHIDDAWENVHKK